MIDLIFIGNGGHARDIEQIVNDINHQRGTYNIIGYLDDSLLRDRLGGIDKFYDYPNAHFVICVNDGKIRRALDDRLMEMAEEENDSLILTRAANLIHPTAYIGDNCIYHNGLVMGPYSVLTTKVRLGYQVHLNSHASVNQNSIIGDFCTLSPGARVCGDCEVGSDVNMGANSVVINVKKIGAGSTIGAGAVVINDIAPNITVVGVPAKPVVTNGEVVWG